MDSTARLCMTSLKLGALSVLVLVFLGIEHELLGNNINTIYFNLVAIAIQSVSTLAALITGIISLRRLSKNKTVPEKYTAAAWVGTIIGGVFSIPAVVELVGFAMPFIR
jgi:hypothetical protein